MPSGSGGVAKAGNVLHMGRPLCWVDQCAVASKLCMQMLPALTCCNEEIGALLYLAVHAMSDLSPQLWGMPYFCSMRLVICSPTISHTFGMQVIAPRCGRHLRAVLVHAQQSQERTKTVLITGRLAACSHCGAGSISLP